MATKRPAPDVHPSRKEQVPQDAPRKRQKPDHGGTKSFKKAHPVNELKTQIRSLTRLLQQDLPANVRVTKERALQTAQHELRETKTADRKGKMIARYHKIRFFDRQKATKRLKRAKKALKESAAEDSGVEKREELGRRVDEAEVDLNYALCYPLDMAYSALFPTKRKGPDEDGEEAEKLEEQERKGDPKMWELVRECMGNGKLDALRNGRLTAKAEVEESEDEKMVPVKVKTKAKPKPKRENAGKADVGVGGLNRRQRRQQEAEESEAESEGGFFE